MVKLKIDGQNISVPQGTTILEAAERVGIKIPHLCYLKDINEIGACRVCLVEKVGMEKLVTACNTEVEEGIEILTNSPRVREVRRINVEFILSDHDCKCVQCVKSGNCTLQKIANDLGIIEQPYKNIADVNRWDFELPLIREQNCVEVEGKNVITADLINKIIYITDPIIVCETFDEMVKYIASGDVGLMIDGADK